MIALTALYVPGDRPDRFDKAFGSGADIVILDLEDAVAPDRRAFALETVRERLTDRPPDGPAVQVRVNRGTPHEIAALAPTGVGLRIPKVETHADVAEALQTGLPVTAILETARGILGAEELARTGVAALAIGESDLASELGASGTRMRDDARIRVRWATAAAGLPAPMLSVYPAIRDLVGLGDDTRHGAELGFVGRAAVHPAQLPAIREAFRPSPEEVRRAREVVSAPPGATTLGDGSLVDDAMRGRAARILELEAAATR